MSRAFWLTWLGLFAAAVAMHAAFGAFESGFGGFEDEPAHLVTALMIRDWLTAGWQDPSVWTHPRAFATDYYVHYPKVGIGQWPPVFHGAFAVWMLMFGTTKVALTLFLSLLASLTAAVVAGLVRPVLGVSAGFLAGLALLAVPVFQLCSASAMTETPVAFLGLLAVLAFGRFMEAPGPAWAFTFAGLSILTILTKGSGLALALVPPLAVLMSGRWDLLRVPSLWLAGLTVGAATAPWFLATVGMTQESWAGGASPSWGYATFAAESLLPWIVDLGGPAGLIALAFGLGVTLRAARRVDPGATRWFAVSAWMPALLILHVVIPSSVEERHLAVLAPAWIVFSCVGAGLAARHASERWSGGLAGRLGPAAGIAGLMVCAALWNGGPVQKAMSGWGDAAAELSPPLSRVVIASDPTGEGLFVAGAALADDQRPSRWVLRASKALCWSGWSGRTYEQRFEGPQEIGAFLDAMGVAVIVLDGSAQGTRHWYEHMEQLAQLTGHESQFGGLSGPAVGSWGEVGRWDVVRHGVRFPGALVAYGRAGAGRETAMPEPTLEAVRWQPLVKGAEPAPAERLNGSSRR